MLFDNSLIFFSCILIFLVNDAFFLDVQVCGASALEFVRI